jgi:2-phosphosulfolactate phosphatase
VTNFAYYPLSKARGADGIVVVVDVLRAFTTAAFAFQKGAEKIYPVSSTAEALRMREQHPTRLVMGEENGYKPESFDFGNSPVEIAKMDLKNKILIQRTSAGTQGLVRAGKIQNLLAASFVVARATACYLKESEPARVSFIITGKSRGRDGDEDFACAEYIQALISKKNPNSDDYLKRIQSSSVGRSFINGSARYITEEDLKFCSQANLFDFVMVVNEENGYLVMRPFRF